jgi:putative ABC transport system permease protein
MLPGVSGVGAVNNLPLGFDGSDTFFWRDGQPAPQRGQAPLANVQVISDGYFGAMGIPLHAGRAFDTRDTEKGTPVLIINRALAEKYFKGEEPLGRSLRLGSGDKPYQIVGIVGDVRHEPFSDNLSLEPELAVYQPHAQNAWSQMMFVVRADGTAAAAVTPAVRRELQALDKDQPIFNVLTMDQVFVISMAPQRLSSFMFGGFALIALLIAAVGIYAVVAYTVAQRTHEIGIRMALGAQRGDIMSLVVGQGMKLIAFGIGAGLLASLAVTRLMASILYGVSSTDFVTFAAISVLLAAVAAVACYVPARRAAKVDPMEALRYE